MASDVLTLPFAQPPSVAGGIAKRVLRQFQSQVEDWCDECRDLSVWEDRYLVDQLIPERLAEHAQRLDLLEQVGHWLDGTARSPEFPDSKISELVTLTLQDLKDRRALWHGKMDSESRENILRSVFNEP